MAKKFKISQNHIKSIFEKALQRIKEGKRVNIYQLMKEAGYSEYSARSQKVFRTKCWEDLLKNINEEPLLGRLEDIALEKKDKRASIEAIKEIFKLKDRYPKQKLAFELLNEEISKVEDDKEELE